MYRKVIVTCQEIDDVKKGVVKIKVDHGSWRDGKDSESPVLGILLTKSFSFRNCQCLLMSSSSPSFHFPSLNVISISSESLLTLWSPKTLLIVLAMKWQYLRGIALWGGSVLGCVTAGYPSHHFLGHFSEPLCLCLAQVPRLSAHLCKVVVL